MVEHVTRFSPAASVASLRPEDGPLGAAAPDFLVLELELDRQDDAWLYITAGANRLRPTQGTGHEFLIMCPDQDRWMVDILAMVAWYSASPDHDGVHDGHTLNIGAPWMAGSEADHLYVNTPYLLPQEFLTMAYEGEPTTHFLWLVPITEAERDWRHEHGQEAFEQLMEADGGINVADPHRPSLV